MLIAPGACPALNSSVVLHNHNKQVWKVVIFGFFQNIISKYINRLLYLTSKYLWPARRSSWATRTGTEVGTPTTSSKFPFKPHIVLQYKKTINNVTYSNKKQFYWTMINTLFTLTGSSKTLVEQQHFCVPY